MIIKLWRYRELLAILVWKEITVRYKQAYLGVAWAVLKPVMLMLIFTAMRSFIGIDSGDVPYPVLTYAALMPWVLFQESVSTGINSVVGNAALIKKIYFPREVFPVSAVLTKLVELFISFIILAGLMIWYRMVPSWYALWVPALILYTLLVALAVSLIGAAMNVRSRDVASFLPVAISLLMYGSPIIYPMSLVQKTLLENQAAGVASEWLYKVYCMNPVAGIITGFQNTLLRAQPPDVSILLPGILVTIILFPLALYYFKRAEIFFADII